MSAILSIVYRTKTVFSCFLACQYVLHCVYSGLSVDCFNKDYHHHRGYRRSEDRKITAGPAYRRDLLHIPQIEETTATEYHARACSADTFAFRIFKVVAANFLHRRITKRRRCGSALNKGVTCLSGRGCSAAEAELCKTHVGRRPLTPLPPLELRELLNRLTRYF